ncbi:fimbrial protein [Serratia liquefaciens]|uniref:fimbrial protein n=1 Tax=Serratia liquefaciens TaxID=614 RepID=UPI00076B8C7D|nr:fimbrial protein [Serratia liquefaciens]
MNLSAIIANGTCAVSVLPQNITFLPVAQNVFTQAKKTSQIKPLVLTLDQCHGLGGGSLRAAVQVNGAMAGYDTHLFRDADSTAKGVGIMMRAEKYTDSVDDFYNPDAAVLTGQYTHELQSGVVPTDGTQLDYSVGFTNGNGTEEISPGDLKATLQFTFLYH